VALVVRCAADIAPQKIEWLWPGRIASGKVTIVAGEPGLGKSHLTCWVASRVTTSGSWPCQEGTAIHGSVIILSAEDDAADTIRPRLDASEADAKCVHVVSALRAEDGKGRRAFNLQADLALLENETERIGDVRLVVIDPVTSDLGKVDSHKNAELRAVLEPLAEMAARLRVAILAVTHLNKGGSGSANNRFIGSIALCGSRSRCLHRRPRSG
jgi:RecA-family ATPase